MEDAKAYQCANFLQRRDAARALDEFVPRMRWGPGELVLDVGSGSGDVTAEILAARLPPDARVVGVDVSAAMVQHAAAQFADARLSFAVMDVARKADGPPGRFSKVVSFYCLHWVSDQRAAMENISRRLAPGGEALLVFLAGAPIFQLWRKMASKQRWSKYMEDMGRFISPYQDSKEPEAELSRLLAGVGLRVEHCSCRSQTFEFNAMDSLQTQIEVVTPFLDRMPAAERAAFIEDCMAEVLAMGLVRRAHNNNNKEVEAAYSLLVAHATKPLDGPQD